MAAMQRVRGLYAITPDEFDTGRLRSIVAQAINGGAQMIQYRNKSGDDALRRKQAIALAALCREAATTFIVNDDVDLALAVGADGVHLGRDDASIVQARSRLGPAKLVGASCYDRLAVARAAVESGADHVAFGSFFASSVKPGAVQATPALLRAAKRELMVPVIAIGGITAENAPVLIASGADAIAVISAVFGAADVRSASARLQALFAPTLLTTHSIVTGH
jgi:thiamine-phosphate pyrophosphorylase